MSRSPTLTPPRPSAARTPPTAVRIRFGTTPPADGERTLRIFVDPRAAAAITAPVDADVPPATDDLHVLISPDRRPPTGAEAWLAPTAADLPRSVAVAVDGGRLQWRDGRAALTGPVPSVDDVLLGLAEFAFYEAELRALEAALPAFERTAADDVHLAYRIRDGNHQARFGQTMEELARLRLTFARLEPRLGRASRSLPPAARQAFHRLLRRADVEDRLAGVSDRLEACEDLYEGAVDRATDHRWWQKGHRLEAIIVALLAVEGAQLAVELFLRVLEYRRH